MADKLTEEAIRGRLEAHPEWRLERKQLVRVLRFPRFADGIELVRRVAVAADAMDHHPDIDIRYTTVRVALSSHDAGGVTERDLRLAAEIDRLVEAGTRGSEILNQDL